MPPETRYAKSGDINIAYQVVGEGPIDLVWVPGFVSHLEVGWEEPLLARFLQRLASFSRMIMFDKRGTGLSDPVQGVPTLEERTDDVRAVMDAAGSERAALFGYSEGGAMAALFAATYPQRTSALVMYSSYAKLTRDVDYPYGPTSDVMKRLFQTIRDDWAEGPMSPLANPSVANDEQYKRWWARLCRVGASPRMAEALMRMNDEIDIRDVLPAIQVPTLIMHRAGETWIEVGHSRYLAERIPGAKYIELPGVDHWPWIGDSDTVLGEVQEFLTGVRPAPEPDRVLATVLFTDIVASTERAAELGDHRWRDLLDSYYGLARRELERFRGREIKTMGDGFLATFDGPARGIRCACAVSDSATQLGLAIRAGLHTGECETMGEDVGGIAVHIGARVAAEAAAGEVLVSSTVKDLVAGSGIQFEDRGSHALKGVPEEWRLFAVERNEG